MCALSVATADALSKKALATDNDTYLVAWVRIGYAVPFLIFILPFIDIPELDNVFFIVTFVLIPLEITALILYMKAWPWTKHGSPKGDGGFGRSCRWASRPTA